MAIERSMETLAVHGGEQKPGPHGSVVFPIYQGTVYTTTPGTPSDQILYPRLNNTPSQVYLHDKLRALEGAEAAVATASGMAAMTATLMALVKRGDHVLLGDCLYGGTLNFVTQYASELGFTYTFVNPQDPQTWRPALTAHSRLFLLESMTNPLLRVPRLLEAVQFAREARLITVLDNTFATPVNFRPLSVGFDVVFHSATKYLNGHTDLIAGCVMAREDLITKVRRTLNLLGGSLDPHAGFMLARGIKTLALRVKAQNATAQKLAEFLARHPAITEVNYPGLPGHPDHAHAAQLFSGFGGMLSIRLRGGLDAAERLLAALELPAVAPSLGGVESLITRPATTSHSGLRADEREKLGITDDLVRVSCGIEGTDDLIADFRQALERA